jgi:hypothetical protein
LKTEGHVCIVYSMIGVLSRLRVKRFWEFLGLAWTGAGGGGGGGAGGGGGGGAGGGAGQVRAGQGVL